LWLGGAPVTNNCTVAWGLLSNSTTTAYLPAIRRSLAATLTLDEGNVDGSIQAALHALAGMGTDAQQYMVMASIAPFWTTGKANVYREMGNYTEAAMVEQAAQQRNTQWAAEERLFSRIVRPMMTFFEAFLFAISPLMMFAIGLGPVGIGMIGKYLIFALWIQLWKPIMAVVHLYVIMAAGRKLDALQDTATGDVPIPSLSSIWKMDLILSDYLGTGGMLAASTPAISLMLIYGSAITATHLAGRLQGSDHINEKTMSPDVAQPAAALSMGPL
jgi:conjugal transfer mating pair stabilization protein TraG